MGNYICVEINDESAKNDGIKEAIENAIEESILFENEIEISKEKLNKLSVDCDKKDYILSACCGVLAGVFDVFLVGKPGDSKIQKKTDEWVENRIKDFAKICGWKDDKQSVKSAIRFLEKKFKVPYDQTTIHNAASEVYEINTFNHHFKSLAHNPSLLGLMCSILDQFYNQSHFVDNGRLIILEKASDSFRLQGKTLIGKVFCGFVNWIGHLLSDIAGSSGSKGRGMGIPSPLWTWINDVIVIKNKIGISSSEFDKQFYEFSMQIYKEGYDVRYQLTQTIPVCINTLLVKVVYSIRRFIRFYRTHIREERSLGLLWKECNPFNNATVCRMQLIAYISMESIDIGDALLKGSINQFNLFEFTLRINIVGVKKTIVTIYKDRKFRVNKQIEFENYELYKNELECLNQYIKSLKQIAKEYEDKYTLDYVIDLENTNIYTRMEALEKSAKNAEKAGVPNEKILHDINDLDRRFKKKRL